MVKSIDCAKIIKLSFPKAFQLFCGRAVSLGCFLLPAAMEPTVKHAWLPRKKVPMALPFWVPEMALTRQAASGWKRLLPNPLSMGKTRMNQSFWVKVMAERLNPQRKTPKGDQIGKGYTDRIIADERLRYRDKDNIGQNDDR